MNWFAALLVMLALAACAEGGQAQAPYALYAPENTYDRGGGGGGRLRAGEIGTTRKTLAW
jgi:hypothetical protein